MNKKIVGVILDGKETWHVVGVGGGDYATLCGMDGNDSVVGQTGTIEPKRGQKIDCAQCKHIWQDFMGLKLRRSNFE